MMLKESIGSWLRGATVPNIGRRSWRCGRAARPMPLAEGSTAKLECRLDTVAGGELQCITLVEGLVECPCGEGLRPVELQWLQSLLTKHIERCRRGFDVDAVG